MGGFNMKGKRGKIAFQCTHFDSGMKGKVNGRKCFIIWVWLVV